jgi:plasmid maintenance system killer protein
MITPRVTTSRVNAIDIEWADRRLAKSTATDRTGERQFGKERWALLRRRIASLLASPTLADLENAPGRCHALTADRAGQFCLDLWGPYRLAFEPTAPIPRLADGGVDRRAVTSVRILEIVNYHD